VLVRAGRVSVNGVVVRDLGHRADPARDRVAVDGQHVRVGPRRTIMLHKPRGVVTTLEDPEGRPTVADLVTAAGARLYPVGRLDVNTSGLLLLTNDGALAAALTHPRHAVPRVYHVKVRGIPTAEAITRLRRGVRLDGRKTAPARVRLLEALPTKSWLEITVREGRTHLVRRLCEAVGHPVDKLARVRLGPLGLGALAPGAWRDVTPRELAALRIVAGFTREAGTGGGGRGRRARGRRPRTPPSRPESPPRGGARDGGSGPTAPHPRSPRPRPTPPRP
jgi:23S rRNA pseudouridine2605 synthase